MNTLHLTAVIYPDDEDPAWLVAYNPETGTTSQGQTFAEALANLREATELYLEDFPLRPPSTARPIVTTFDLPLAHA